MATLQVQAAAIASKPATNHAPLLGDPEANVTNDAHHQQPDTNAAGGSFLSWLPAFLGFFLTLNSATAIVRSRGDAANVAFVCFSYADLVALFLCLRMYERARAGSAKRTYVAENRCMDRDGSPNVRLLRQRSRPSCRRWWRW
ncbi:unnamed protein product [Urochloa humidicola]